MHACCSGRVWGGRGRKINSQESRLKRPVLATWDLGFKQTKPNEAQSTNALRGMPGKRAGVSSVVHFSQLVATPIMQRFCVLHRKPFPYNGGSLLLQMTLQWLPLHTSSSPHEPDLVSAFPSSTQLTTPLPKPPMCTAIIFIRTLSYETVIFVTVMVSHTRICRHERIWVE